MIWNKWRAWTGGGGSSFALGFSEALIFWCAPGIYKVGLGDKSLSTFIWPRKCVSSVCMGAHMGHMGVICDCGVHECLDAQVCELYTRVSVGMVCVPAVTGSVRVVVSVDVVRHLSAPRMLTRMLGTPGPDGSAPELCRGRGHLPPPASPLHLFLPLFLSPCGLTPLSSASSLAALGPSVLVETGERGLPPLPSCSLTLAHKPLTKAAGFGQGK